MKLEDFVIRANDLVQTGKTVLSTRHRSSQFEFVDATQFSAFRSAVLSYLLNVFGDNHPYYREFDTRVKGPSPSDVERGIGILQAAYGELSGGWIQSAKSILSAEIFSDFLQMASYLLFEGYKDAAAVMIGSVLEGHLRQLCQKANIESEVVKADIVVPKKADTLNSDLAKHEVYGKLDQKSVTAWLDLRNKAAHGKYEEYTRDQVSLMYQGVVEFMTQVPV